MYAQVQFSWGGIQSVQLLSPEACAGWIVALDPRSAAAGNTMKFCWLLQGII